MKIPSRRNEKNNQLIINKAAVERGGIDSKVVFSLGELTPALGVGLIYGLLSFEVKFEHFYFLQSADRSKGVVHQSRRVN